MVYLLALKFLEKNLSVSHFREQWVVSKWELMMVILRSRINLISDLAYPWCTIG